jgi:hypothetical protein
MLVSEYLSLVVDLRNDDGSANLCRRLQYGLGVISGLIVLPRATRGAKVANNKIVLHDEASINELLAAVALTCLILQKMVVSLLRAQRRRSITATRKHSNGASNYLNDFGSSQQALNHP